MTVREINGWRNHAVECIRVWLGHMNGVLSHWGEKGKRFVLQLPRYLMVLVDYWRTRVLRLEFFFCKTSSDDVCTGRSGNMLPQGDLLNSKTRNPVNASRSYALSQNITTHMEDIWPPCDFLRIFRPRSTRLRIYRFS